MEIVITLRDDNDGHVVIEETRQLAPGETEESVTVASLHLCHKFEHGINFKSAPPVM